MSTTHRQRELFNKLLIIARGDMELVQTAIRLASPIDGGEADLEEVVKYIVKHRDRVRQREVA